MLKRIAVIVLLSLPFAAWAFIKPVRVLAPELAGVQCRGNVCVDQPARLDEATRLFADAVAQTEREFGTMQTVPRAIFCSTPACSHAFGLDSAAAYNFGTSAEVIGHKAWQPHFVRHELVHHVQSERLGSLNNWLLKPKWFREGMAYSLSGDPRRPLPQPLEGYRAQFESWYPGKARVWAEAERL